MIHSLGKIYLGLPTLSLLSLSKFLRLIYIRPNYVKLVQISFESGYIENAIHDDDGTYPSSIILCRPRPLFLMRLT